MSNFVRGLIHLLLWGLFPAVAEAVDFLWQEENSSLKLSGYYKSLLIRSETVSPENEPFTLYLNRSRLKLLGRVGEWMALDLQYDHEVFLGSFLKTDQFLMQKNQQPNAYLDLENSYVDRSWIFARHRLYRGYVTISSSSVDVTAGRQRVAWGTGRFWNPTDLLNPVNSTQIEREEQSGVDAVVADIHLGTLSRLSVVYAPQDTWKESNIVASLHTNLSGFDFSPMWGRFEEDVVVGSNFSGAIKNAGIHAEAIYTAAEGGNNFIRAVWGADYAFSNTFSIMVEYYYNGQGKLQKEQYEFQKLLSGELLNLARHYLGLSVGYDFTPLLQWDNFVILNLNDGSVFFSPNITYSVTTNLDWVLGLQVFKGIEGSEYDFFSSGYYTHLQWFF